MMQECGTCGARWVETSQPSPVTHCPWCGALLSADGETPTTHPATLDQPLAPQLHPSDPSGAGLHGGSVASLGWEYSRCASC